MSNLNKVIQLYRDGGEFESRWVGSEPWSTTFPWV